MTVHWLDAGPKCPACEEDLQFWVSASKRCRNCGAPLDLHGAELLVWLPVGAFCGAAILVETPLYIMGGGAWLLLSIPAGLFAFIVAWWATWRCCISATGAHDTGDSR